MSDHKTTKGFLAEVDSDLPQHWKAALVGVSPR